ncbi:helix-turn-helix domain-containing protein [Paenibacillus odorifer]|uniref:helix-turn-helix domain-containing protein n=1 Tax=Paenibacillus odorifer TaxID=189426 RepID=UPI00096E6437|nr:helix-turn-helix transcriptional regulator [Paenibacillus odorifer]OME12784.1 hypothetical protein BSK60_16915 [Paenibacillus odorifer]
MIRNINRISLLRLSKPYSQKEMAMKLGITQSYYGKLERNPGNISLEVAIKIKQILGVEHVDDLMDEAS